MNKMPLLTGKPTPYQIAYDEPTDDHINVIYESENFVVIYFPSFPLTTLPGGVQAFIPRPGFEVVDRSTDTAVYLHDEWAALFSVYLNRWKMDPPEQDVVENVLSQYSTLGNLPMIQQ